MKVAVEPFSIGLFMEIIPLAQKCWDEATVDKGVDCANAATRDEAIDPDIEFYGTLAATGRIRIITLRDGEDLRGYCVGFIYRSPHNKNALIGGGDSIYLEPQDRCYGAVMVEKLEQELQAMGARGMGWPIHMNSPMFQVLKARGYTGDEIVMEKVLCASL